MSYELEEHRRARRERTAARRFRQRPVDVLLQAPVSAGIYHWSLHATERTEAAQLMEDAFAEASDAVQAEADRLGRQVELVFHESANGVSAPAHHLHVITDRHGIDNDGHLLEAAYVVALQFAVEQRLPVRFVRAACPPGKELGGVSQKVIDDSGYPVCRELGYEQWLTPDLRQQQRLKAL